MAQIDEVKTACARLASTNEEYRALCRENVAAWLSGGLMRLCLQHSEMQRGALVTKLCAGQPRSISQLAKGSNITRQAITKHLRVLESAGVVRSVRSGRESPFEFEVSRSSRSYLDLVSDQWDQALARLKSFVEV